MATGLAIWGAKLGGESFTSADSPLGTDASLGGLYAMSNSGQTGIGSSLGATGTPQKGYAGIGNIETDIMLQTLGYSDQEIQGQLQTISGNGVTDLAGVTQTIEETDYVIGIMPVLFSMKENSTIITVET